MYNNNMKKLFVIFLCVICSSTIFAKVHPSVAEFRDTFYNNALNSELLEKVYKDTVSIVNSELEGYELYVELSRCEYFMGRCAFFREEKKIAAKYFDKGIDYAKEALNIKKGADAYIMHAENISQNCAVKSTLYAMSNGLKIADYAKEALEFDPNIAAALYLIEARHIYAPAPFNNLDKGIKNMTSIVQDTNVKFEKDDLFNFTSGIAYGYVEIEEWENALIWINKAIEIYPSNFFVLELKNQILDNK